MHIEIEFVVPQIALVVFTTALVYAHRAGPQTPKNKRGEGSKYLAWVWRELLSIRMAPTSGNGGSAPPAGGVR
jgi:hypothetical protein